MNYADAEESYNAALSIQVSIGAEQSRLVSPRTPALEKVHALQNGDDFFSNDPTLASDTQLSSPQLQDRLDYGAGGGRGLLEHEEQSSHTGIPASRARPSDTRATLREAFASRTRSSSGPERALENIQKAILSIPKKLSLSQPLTTLHREASDDTATELPPRPQLQRLKSGGSSLRKSFSDESLALSRAFSQASSLGDDSRFEHIQNQVNSRMKAIRDSWQDTSIKLPSLSSFKPDIFRSQQTDDSKVSSFKPDFLRSHGHSRSIDHPVDPLTRQPFQSYEALQEDLKRSGHTLLDQALAGLEGDVIVLGGYRGSILRSATPPNKQLWVPIKVGLNLRKVDLEVGIAPEDDHKPADNIIADGMLKHIGPVDISSRLFRRLRSCANAQAGTLRVHDYGYDWRLDPRFLSRQLCDFVSQLQGPVIVIAHSLGGLITRHAINQQPKLFRGVVYAGVPTRCVNILGPLRNGDDVLLSSRVLTAQVNFTIRTSFALLPLDGRCFIDLDTKEEYRVDFFDPDTWRECRLTPCISRALVAMRKEPTGLASYVAKALPALPRRSRLSLSTSGATEPSTSAMASSMTLDGAATSREAEKDADQEQTIDPTVSTIVTIPPDEAFAYLTRALASVKRFKEELAFRPEIAEAYPPLATIYGKNTPTVVGARVVSREAIKRADAYDNLSFGSGDGVVLARAALPPKGYTVARGGLISSERGHVSLLGDLDAVGRALLSITSVAAPVEQLAT